MNRELALFVLGCGFAALAGNHIAIGRADGPRTGAHDRVAAAKTDDKKTGGKKPGGKVEHGFIKRVHNGSKYQVFIPHSYKGDKPFPTIMFLHGAGECGTDGERMMGGCLGSEIRRHVKTFQFIAVFPQAHETWGAATPDGQRAMAILADVEKHYKVDSKRIYLTGYSMGGHGTWSLGALHPDRWAAIAPVAGWGPFDPFTFGKPPVGRPDEDSVRRMKDVPCWCFCAQGDRGVLPAYVEHMLQSLKKAGGHPKVKHFGNDVTHDNIPSHVYPMAELYSWFLQHKKK